MPLPSPNPWLYYPKPHPTAKIRLYCFPYAGGGALLFRDWAASFAAQVEVVGVQPPGRETRLTEPAVSRIEPLLDALTDAILPALREKPFAFYGHSLGALVSFELTRRLARAGEAMPLHLFVAARPAPQIPMTEPPVYALSDTEFMEQLRLLKGTPETVLEHRELMELMLPMLRADFTVNDTYEYQDAPPLPCALSVFGGTHDKEVPREELEVWRIHTINRFILRMIPGDHFFLQSGREYLLEAIRRDLAAYL